MVTRECQTDTCSRRKRHRRAMWMIDGVPYCNPCYERFMETAFVEEHRITRLSDNESDFTMSNARPSEVYAHRCRKNHACKAPEPRVASAMQA